MSVLKTKKVNDRKIDKFKEELVNPKGQYSCLNMQIDRQLHTEFKIMAAEYGDTMTALISRLMRDYLNGRKVAKHFSDNTRT